MTGDPGERNGTLGMALAAVLTTAAFVAAGIAGKTFPFGPRSRSTLDLGMQYVPLHAHLWDLLHGTAKGDLFFNWQSGFGVPFLPDFGIYLASPLALSVGVLPREQVDLAVYLITVVKLIAAAAAMAAYLVRLRPGPWWLAGTLGASYGLCGWAIDEGAYVVMWLDGMIAFPLFCLVGEWCLLGRRRLVGIAVFAVFWYANFYTAYMATIGAGVVFVVRLLLSDLAWTVRLKATVRYAVSAVVGIGLTAPLLLPVIEATRIAQPTGPVSFNPSGVDAFLSRLLPLVDGLAIGPRIFVGTVALLLALTLPLNKAVPVATRAAWTIAVILVATSLLWEPTHKLWHGFDVPNGNPYRQAFVLCGVLVIAGWQSAAYRRPGILPMTAALAALAGLLFVTRDTPLVNHDSVVVCATAAALAGLAILLSGRVAAAAAAVLACTVLVEGSLTATAIQRTRADTLWAAPAWRNGHSAARNAIDTVSGWPAYRTDAVTEFTANGPLLLGGESGSYYSSVLPEAVHRMLDGLGFRWSAYGRSLPGLDNPVVDAVFSVGVKVRGDTVQRSAAPPLVTVRSAPMPGRADTVFGRQEALIGGRVYDVPAYRVHALGQRRFRIDATCRPGTVAFLYLPFFVGTAQLADGARIVLWASRRSPWIDARGGLLRIGETPRSGRISVALQQVAGAPGVPATGALACLDRSKLAATIERLRETGATEVEVGGHSIEATLPRPTTGIAVVAVPKVPGWRCAGKEPDDFGGLLAVRLTEPATKVRCSYRPPGFLSGLVIAGVAALITAGVAAGAVRNAVRRGGRGGGRGVRS